MKERDPHSNIGKLKDNANTSSKLAAVNKALLASEIRFRHLFETTKDGILLINAETDQIEDVNPYLIELLGHSHDEFLGKKLWDIKVFKESLLNQQAFAELKEKRFIRYDELTLVDSNGCDISVEFIGNVYDCAGIDVIQCNIRDNTKRHLAEIALKATTRSLELLSETNIALIKSRTELNLLTEYCRIAVITGGYRMAWVGIYNNSGNKNIEIVAHYGHEKGFLELAQFTCDETLYGISPTGRAIRENKVQISINTCNDPSMRPWSEEALKRGYNSTIAIPVHLPDKKIACLTLYSNKPKQFTPSELNLLQEIAADLEYGVAALRTAITRLKFQESLRISLEQTIQVIADTIGERDPYTEGHQKRVANICARVGNELGLSEDRIHGLYLAAIIHDLGKIAIPAEILTKPRQLNEIEFNLIKEHPTVGYNLIKDIEFPWPIAKIIYQHHERIDGSGYPLGLKSDEILLEAKILGVADVVEAISSHRPYRPALGNEVAMDEITDKKGKAFDTDVVNAFLSVFNTEDYKIQN